jgi:hypothetical protein
MMSLLFVMYADFSQFVLLDRQVSLDQVHEPPFWSAENPATDLFSVRANAQAVSVSAPGKGEILLEVEILGSPPDAPEASWSRVGVSRLELPSGQLGISEILELENPIQTLQVTPGTYQVRASLSGWDWDAPVAVPPELRPEGVEDVYQRAKLELWPEKPQV